VRLIELHRVLKPTGSLYLHCDPTASHYLKTLCDAVFGARYFQNEITWKRTFTHGDSRTWSRAADKILFYTNSDQFTWNVPYEKHSDGYVESHYGQMDAESRRYQLTSILSPSPRPNMMYEWKGFPSPPMGWRFSRETMTELDRKGLIWYPTKKDGSFDTEKRPRYKRYLDEQKGTVVTTVWTDIPPINSQAQERLGYPTQKPIALLERIIAASSNEGDVVLDPFCGCGTTIHAAQKLKRQWIGIDVTHLAIALIERRLKEAFPGIKYEVHGVPKDTDAARDLAERDKYEFQKWIVATIGGQPYKGGQKGMDRGVDGYLHFRDSDKKPQMAVISVKGGGTNSGHVRDLRGTMERLGAMMGVFLSLNPPTREMEKEAASAGLYESGGVKVPRMQILTAADVIEGKRPKVPFGHTESLRKAKPEESAEQGELSI
jgi:site-specific DNA-methyltransferase (adenine-specific)